MNKENTKTSETKNPPSEGREAGLYNEDLAPVPASKRTWGTWNYAALWISMSLCIPTYTMASSMINNGMSWWQSVLTIFIGNAIVLVPMLLNGHAGAKYGIPFPVFARASFGTKGANIPAMLRAIVSEKIKPSCITTPHCPRHMAWLRLASGVLPRRTLPELGA